MTPGSVSICFVYFRSLGLSNLEAALYSVRQQKDFACVRELVVIDNNTDDFSPELIYNLDFPVPVSLHSHKHGDPLKTHSWSTNAAVRAASASWVFFTRADYLLAFDALEKFTTTVDAKPEEWDGFVTSRGCHLDISIGECEQLGWRRRGPQVFTATGTVYDYTPIDAGVWMARRESFNRVGGLNEQLTAWGHAQTHFQWKLARAGVEFALRDEVLFFHPNHGGAKDLDLANRQLAEQGVSLQEMWARYSGPRMY